MNIRVLYYHHKTLAIRTRVLYNVHDGSALRNTINTDKLVSQGCMKRIPSLAIIAILVADQDEALCFYTEKLGLEKRTDVTFGPGMRWLTVAPSGQRKPEIALAIPDASLCGTQILRNREGIRGCGNGINWVFDTDDCCTMYRTLLARGVNFLSPPTKQLYGMEAVFEDPYGNMFSLLEPSPEAYSMFEKASIGTAA